MQQMYIKPKSGLIIRDPESYEILPQGGAKKPQSSYWLRHLKDGNVYIVSPNQETETTHKKGDKK